MNEDKTNDLKKDDAVLPKEAIPVKVPAKIDKKDDPGWTGMQYFILIMVGLICLGLGFGGGYGSYATKLTEANSDIKAQAGEIGKLKLSLSKANSNYSDANMSLSKSKTALSVCEGKLTKATAKKKVVKKYKKKAVTTGKK